jgi:hypothetical protein
MFVCIFVLVRSFFGDDFGMQYNFSFPCIWILVIKSKYPPCLILGHDGVQALVDVGGPNGGDQPHEQARGGFVYGFVYLFCYVDSLYHNHKR